VIFRRQTFRSPLTRKEFMRRLDALVIKHAGFLSYRPGRIYGKVGSDRFELFALGSTRGHVVWVVGSLDVAANLSQGRLRIVPDVWSVVPLVLIVLVAVASQYLTTSWLQLALPLVALAAIGNFVWQVRAEWRVIAERLGRELQVTIEPARR
jgi:hypothetical protein